MKCTTRCIALGKLSYIRAEIRLYYLALYEGLGFTVRRTVLGCCVILHQSFGLSLTLIRWFLRLSPASVMRIPEET
jgi:hypothetical protein